MTICKITFFSEMAKYDYFQYEYFFKKIVIFRLKNETKKKTYPPIFFFVGHQKSSRHEGGI